MFFSGLSWLGCASDGVTASTRRDSSLKCRPSRGSFATDPGLVLPCQKRKATANGSGRRSACPLKVWRLFDHFGHDEPSGRQESPGASQ
jgi:hypothetical protein